MLIVNARLLNGAVVDVRVANSIKEVAPHVEPGLGEEVFDACGGTVLPGLHDHHVHLRAAAAAMGSVRVGPPHVRTRAELRKALTTAAPDEDGWVRAVGYHESVAGPLDRALLDAVSPGRPVRVQHRSGAMWTFNTEGLARVGRPRHPDGRAFRADPESFPTVPRRSVSLTPLSESLLRRGVTGVTDATPGHTREDVESLSAASDCGELRQRLHCMAGADVVGAFGCTLGPVKTILDDASLDLDELHRWISDCHAADRPVAVHCVTAAQLVVTIAALKAAGVHPLDRIEHAAVVPRDCIADLADLGATVVTQPNFVGERGDEYLDDVRSDEHDQLWRVASLRSAGVPVALSTDLPFGIGDPWAAMRAAVSRRTRSGHVLGPHEAVTPTEALTMFLGEPERPTAPRSVVRGEPGDLCVLRCQPDEALARLSADDVVATIVRGQLVWPNPIDGGARGS